MTYQRLAEIINEMSEEDKMLDVSIYNQEIDEYFSVVDFDYCDDGILDDGHPYLSI